MKCICISFLLLFSILAPAAEIGFAVVDITPDFKDVKDAKGIKTQGYGNQWAKKIYEPLYARAVAIRDRNKNLAVILTVDNCKFHAMDIIALQQEFAKKYNTSMWNLLPNASHTHSAPAWYFLQKHKYAPVYRKIIVNACRKAVFDAVAKLKPGVIKYACLSAKGLIVNRRWKNPETGKSYMAPNLKAPVDNEMPVLAFYDGSGKKLQGLLWSVAGHTTMRGSKPISADYPGEVSRCLKAALGKNLVTMFAQGAAGDTWGLHEHKALEKRLYMRKGRLRAKRLTGKALDAYVKLGSSIAAKRIVDALKSNRFKTLKNISIRAGGGRFIFPAKRPDKKSFAYWRQALKDAKTEKAKSLAQQKLYFYDKNGRYGDPVWLTRIQLAPNLQIVGSSHEICHEHGRNVKEYFRQRGIDAIFFAYCQRGSYLTSNKINREGGYEARCTLISHDFDIDKHYLDKVKSIKIK